MAFQMSQCSLYTKLNARPPIEIVPQPNVFHFSLLPAPILSLIGEEIDIYTLVLATASDLVSLRTTG